MNNPQKQYVEGELNFSQTPQPVPTQMMAGGAAQQPVPTQVIAQPTQAMAQQPVPTQVLAQGGAGHPGATQAMAQQQPTPTQVISPQPTVTQGMVNSQGQQDPHSQGTPTQAMSTQAMVQQVQPEPTQVLGHAAGQQAERSTANLSPVHQEVPLALEHALIRTLAMLQQHNLASAEDCSQVAALVRRSWESGQGADPLEKLAQFRAGGGDMLGATVEMISMRMAHSLPFAPTRVPFAGRLIAPTSFYEKHPQIELMCRLMQVPVAFAEDLDVLGLASINPYFADALAAAIVEELKPVSDVQPIISVVRLDYDSWVQMCQKHFKV